MTRWFSLGSGLVTGAVAALGQAPFSDVLGAVPAIVTSSVGFVGLFYLAAMTGRPVLVAWAAGAGYFGVALHWIVEPFLVEPEVHGWMAPFALVLMATGLALFWAAGAWGARRLGGGSVALALALALAEMARGHVFTGFPWALPAYIWADTPFMPVAGLIGPYGLTALTFLVSAVMADLQQTTKRDETPVWRIWILVTVAGVLAGFLGKGLGHSTEAGLGTVLLAQPDARQDEKWDPEKGPGFVRSLIELSAGANGGAADLVVWPETAVPYVLDVAGPVLETASAAAGGVPLMAGINRRDGENWHNSAVLVGPGGAVTDIYDKVHLVPFGEYIPFRIELLRAMAAFSSFGFTPGEAVRLTPTPLGDALVLICYEAIFPGHGRGAGRPDVLIQITNDAWFGDWAGPAQHFQQARFRAVEQGVAMVRVANRGISAVIGPDGQVLSRMDPGQAGALLADVPGPAPLTPYARMGDLPVALILALAFFVAGFRKRFASRPPAS